MSDIRKPVVASMFYPDDRINLKRMINTFLSNVPDDVPEFLIKKGVDLPFGIVAPHAGYFYSGQSAAYGYTLLKDRSVDTIILIGPSHSIAVNGLAATRFKAYETPLGEVPINRAFTEALVDSSDGVIDYLDSAHIQEHSLEVQLPFLQETLEGQFRIVPLVMGMQNYANVQAAAKAIHDTLSAYDKSAVIVISSDLSHYYKDEAARKMDKKLIGLVEAMDAKKLCDALDSREVEACGGGPIAILLEAAKLAERGNVKTLDYRTSADASNDYTRVVGYLSAAVW